jgi:pimeloyl-ACP methyl ester carboxylesterase
MNREVFLSLLAMDAYNRGTGSLINNLGGKGSKIGRATVGEDAETILPPGDAVAAGFYAIAYEWDNNGINETVISYRGTNFPSNWTPGEFVDFAVDVWGGWNFFLGLDYPSQAPLARAFYEQVTTLEFRGEPGFIDPLDTSFNITLTGHSLGGALAGYVGARADAHAVVFDPIPFGDVATTDAISAAVARTVNELGLTDISDFDSIISTVIEPTALFPNTEITLLDFANRLAENLIAAQPRFETVDGFFLAGELAEQIPTLQTELGNALANLGSEIRSPIPAFIIFALGVQQTIQGAINAASSDRDGIIELSNRRLLDASIAQYGIDSVDLHSIQWLTLLLFGEKQWAPSVGGEGRVTCSPDCYQSEIESRSFMMVV